MIGEKTKLIKQIIAYLEITKDIYSTKEKTLNEMIFKKVQK